jgi:F0F1-type ATP synthase alpha subunit
MLAYMEKEGSAILSSIRDKKAIDDATEADLNKALARFKELFT